MQSSVSLVKNKNVHCMFTLTYQIYVLRCALLLLIFNVYRVKYNSKRIARAVLRLII